MANFEETPTSSSVIIHALQIQCRRSQLTSNPKLNVVQSVKFEIYYLRLSEIVNVNVCNPYLDVLSKDVTSKRNFNQRLSKLAPHFRFEAPIASISRR